MNQINSYLTFAGNCQEAMKFYKSCLGGDLILQKIGESPMADRMPKAMQESILHATLSADGFVIMASDMVPDNGLKIGNSVSLMLQCSSEASIRLLFDKLSEGGMIKHPLENTFFDSILGDFIDKFGNNWILNFDKTIK